MHRAAFGGAGLSTAGGIEMTGSRAFAILKISAVAREAACREPA
jgi:hypothetical protein